MQGPANQPAKIGLGTLETVANPSLESNRAVSGLSQLEFWVGRGTRFVLDRPTLYTYIFVLCIHIKGFYAKDHVMDASIYIIHKP